MVTHGNESSTAFERSEVPRRSSDAGSGRPGEQAAEADAGQSTEPGAATGADSPGASEANAVATAELVRQLAEGQVTASAITTEQRRRCVDHLTLEGFSAAEIAELTGVNERTVRRDREALRAEGALTPTRALGDELLGELQKHTHAAVARLARLSNDPAASAYARLWANEAIVRCYQRFVETACRMQYVEPGDKRIRHHQHRKDAEAGVGPLAHNLQLAKQLFGEG